MSFYLNGSVYKKKKNNRILLKENLTDRNQLTFWKPDSYIVWFHSTCTIWCCSGELTFSLFYFLPLPDRFLDHLIYIQYIERRPGEICREKLPGKSCVVEIYDITYVQTSLMKCRADVMATLLPSAKS